MKSKMRKTYLLRYDSHMFVWVYHSPVNQWVPHAGGNGGGVPSLADSEHTLDDRQLSAGGVQAAERTPIIDHHTGCDDLTTPVHSASLDKKFALPQCKGYVMLRAQCRSLLQTPWQSLLLPRHS